MASDIYPIPVVNRAITRPVTIEILRQVMKVTGLNPKEFRTKVLGMATAEKVQGSYLQETDLDEFTNDNPIDNKLNRLTTDKKLTLEIDEEITGNVVTPVRYPDAKPIFLDKELRVRAYPLYSKVKTTLSVVLNVRDKAEASKWIREVKSKLYQTAITNYHEINYYYPIPKEIILYLIAIHQLRENVDGLNESFGHWLKRCFDNRYDIATNLNGEEKIAIIREKQVNIPGFFDFDFDPQKPEKEDDNAGGWRIQFDYIFHWQRPDNVILEYPLMIHNQVLPESLINKKRPDHYQTYNTYTGDIHEAFDTVALHGGLHGFVEPQGIPDPLWDDWFPKDMPVRHIQISRTLISVDIQDKSDVIDFTDISESFSFKKDTISVLDKLETLIVKRNHSPLYFQVFKWHNPLGDSELTVDNRVIKTKKELNLRDMYHVVCFILTDISLLEPEAWSHMLNNCRAFHEWLGTIYPDSGVEKIRCNLDNTVNIDDFREWWNNTAPYTDDISGPLKPGPGLPWASCNGTFCVPNPSWYNKDTDNTNSTRLIANKTINTFSIIAYREEKKEEF